MLAFAEHLDVTYVCINSVHEIVCCQLRMSSNTVLYLASMYFPPPPYTIAHNTLLQSFRQIGEPKIILGDFNSHSMEWGGTHDDSRSRSLISVFDEDHLAILNTGENTRTAAPPAHSSAIDLSLCSSNIALDCTWQVLDHTGRSDHLPIVIEYRRPPDTSRRPMPRRALTKCIDWGVYRSALATRISESSAQGDMLYEGLVEAMLLGALEAQTKPMPTSTGYHRAVDPKAWWNADLQVKYNAKRDAYRHFSRSLGLAEYLAYRNAEAVFKRARRNSKRESWRNFCSSLNRNTSLSSLYAVAKRYRGVSTSTRSTISSTAWLDAFSCKLAPCTVPVAPRSVPRRNNERTAEICMPFAMLELEAALSTTNDSGAGLDEIPFAMLRELPMIAKEHLLRLFNTFLNTGMFPESWSGCKVVAIPKPGKDPNIHTSYRPVCLLSCPRKLFEKLIHARLDFWAEKHRRIAVSQFGFRKGFGTQDCLAVFSADLEQTFARKGITLCVFMDVAAAYDDVIIDILYERLIALHLEPHMAAIVARLFHERTLHFYVNNERCMTRVGYRGLAQGSSLSPLLYNLYTAAIETDIPRGVRILQYADDVALYAEGKSRADGAMLEKEMQCVLNRLIRAYSELGLTISTSKTVYMLFSRNYILPSIRLKLKNAQITRVYEFSYLGIIFDPKCHWKKHTDAVASRCSKRINFLKSVAGSTWGAHPSDLLSIYKATIRSILDYGAHCFQFLANTHKLKLQRIQWRSLRICLGLMVSTHTQSCEVLAGVMPVDIRWRMLTCRLMSKALASPNARLRKSLVALIELKPTHHLAALASEILALPIEQSPVFPCYSLNTLIDSLYAPKVEWCIRDNMATIQDATSIEIRVMFREWAGQRQHTTFIYTDGSRSESGTGSAAFISDEIQTMSRIPEPTNVFTAEMCAIYDACSLIDTSDAIDFTIVTDSMASLKALQSTSMSARNSLLLYKCKNRVARLERSGRNIALAWAPAHRGIEGNEAADVLAKQAAICSQWSTIDAEWQPIAAGSTRQAIERWQNRWRSGDLGRYCHSIIPTVASRSWFTKFVGEIQRPAIRLACRITSNHTCARDHLNRISIVEDPRCHYCRAPMIESVDHLLFECDLFVHERASLVRCLSRAGFNPPYVVRDILSVCENSNVLNEMYAYLQNCRMKL